MANLISEIVGQAKDVKGGQVAIYRALRPLLCSSCGLEIAAGALFTRRKLGNIRILPRCRKCAPFKEKVGSRPSLISSLLEPSSSLTDSRSKILNSNKQEKLAREVEKRLGPALARSRRAKSAR